MRKNKTIFGFCLLVLSTLLFFSEINSLFEKSRINIICRGSIPGVLKIYYDTGNDFNESQSQTATIQTNNWESINVWAPSSKLLRIRFDLPANTKMFFLQSLKYTPSSINNILYQKERTQTWSSFAEQRFNEIYYIFKDNQKLNPPQIIIKSSSLDESNIIKRLFKLALFLFVMILSTLILRNNFVFPSQNQIISIYYALPIYFFWCLTIQNNASFWPFWDQWDVEAANLYRDSGDGFFRLGYLFSSHNEHRILMTRLLNGSLFLLFGEWSTLMNMCINMAIYALLLIFLLTEMCNTCGMKYVSMTLLFCFFGFLVPNHWENILGGIQSQYYLMALFAFGSIYYGIRGKRLAAFSFATCSYFSMAGGVFTFLVLFLMEIVFRILQLNKRICIYYLGLLLFAAFTALFFTPIVKGHDVLKATDLSAFLSSLKYLCSWPSSPNYIALILLKLPVVFLPIFQKRVTEKSQKESVYCLYFFYVWISLQQIAISFSRGMCPSASRYKDLLVIGCFLSVCLWMIYLNYTENKYKRLVLMFICFFFISLNFAIIKNIPTTLNEIESKKIENKMQIKNIQNFLNSDFCFEWPKENPVFFSYPSTLLLSKWMQDPQIIKNLPIESLLSSDTTYPLAVQYISVGPFWIFFSVLLKNSLLLCIVSLFMFLLFYIQNFQKK